MAMAEKKPESKPMWPIELAEAVYAAMDNHLPQLKASIRAHIEQLKKDGYPEGVPLEEDLPVGRPAWTLWQEIKQDPASFKTGNCDPQNLVGYAEKFNRQLPPAEQSKLQPMFDEIEERVTAVWEAARGKPNKHGLMDWTNAVLGQLPTNSQQR